MADTEGVKAVVKNPETGKFLLVKRNDDKKEYPGYWEFPGGGLEDETPVEGVLRELKEETGLKGEVVSGGKPFVWHSEYTDRYIRSYPFLIEVEETEFELSHEHTAHQWLDIDEILDKKHFPFIKKHLKHAGVKIEE